MMHINQWYKAAASNGGTNCVEVMETEDGFLVRDTKDGGHGPVLAFTHAEWDAFLDGVLNGEFDPADAGR
jgi:Domain of unknown function (DUF397)